PVAALAHGGVGQPDGVEMVLVALDAGDVHLNFNNAGINAIHGGAEGLVEHTDRARPFTLADGSEEGCDGCHKGSVMNDLAPDETLPFSIAMVEITKCDLNGLQQMSRSPLPWPDALIPESCSCAARKSFLIRTWPNFMELKSSTLTSRLNVIGSGSQVIFCFESLHESSKS